MFRRNLIVAMLPCALAAWALSVPAPALAQNPPMQTCQLGDLKLESGEVIRNFRMTYITHGTLNPAKSNAILSIHGLQGNRNNQSY